MWGSKICENENRIIHSVSRKCCTFKISLKEPPESCSAFWFWRRRWRGWCLSFTICKRDTAWSGQSQTCFWQQKSDIFDGKSGHLQPSLWQTKPKNIFFETLPRWWKQTRPYLWGRRFWGKTVDWWVSFSGYQTLLLWVKISGLPFLREQCCHIVNFTFNPPKKLQHKDKFNISTYIKWIDMTFLAIRVPQKMNLNEFGDLLTLQPVKFTLIYSSILTSTAGHEVVSTFMDPRWLILMTLAIQWHFPSNEQQVEQIPNNQLHPSADLS